MPDKTIKGITNFIFNLLLKDFTKEEVNKFDIELILKNRKKE